MYPKFFFEERRKKVLIDGRKYWREKDGWYVNFVGDVLPMRYEWRMWGMRYWHRGYLGGCRITRETHALHEYRVPCACPLEKVA